MPFSLTRKVVAVNAKYGYDLKEKAGVLLSHKGCVGMPVENANGGLPGTLGYQVPALPRQHQTFFTSNSIITLIVRSEITFYNRKHVAVFSG